MPAGWQGWHICPHLLAAELVNVLLFGKQDFTDRMKSTASTKPSWVVRMGHASGEEKCPDRRIRMENK